MKNFKEKLISEYKDLIANLNNLDFKENLILEYNDLVVRLNNLEDFIFSDKVAELDKIQIDLMTVQYEIMKSYLEVLSKRVDNIPDIDTLKLALRTQPSDKK